MRKYDHLERLDSPQTAGLLQGEVFVFPKMDGTNASIWFDRDTQTLECGSRNNRLTEGSDNHGFRAWLETQDSLRAMCADHPDYVFYGEWLVPHSVKTYDDDAWRRLYIFDAWHRPTNTYAHFYKLTDLVKGYTDDYLRPLARITNPKLEELQRLAVNDFKCKAGTIGEGIVCKNYEWRNRFDHQPWGKLVVNRPSPNPNVVSAPADCIEAQIVAKFVDQHFVDKTKAKCIASFKRPDEIDGQNTENFYVRHKLIPMLLGLAYHDLVVDEAWNIAKQWRNPTVNFALLNRLTTQRVKELAADLF